VGKPSIPEDLVVSVQGISEDQAYAVGTKLRSIVSLFSEQLPLQSLDGITIGLDYAEAISSVDLGFGEERPVSKATDDNEQGSGAAMALPVVRSGVLKTHLVFGPLVAMYLSDLEDQEKLLKACQLITHELGHAVDYESKFKAFGETIFGRVSDDDDNDPLKEQLWVLGHHIWDEYSANRIATMVCRRGEDDRELFLSVHDSWRDRILLARESYKNRELEMEELMEVVRHNFYMILLAAGYIFGMKDANAERGIVVDTDEVDDILSSKLYAPITAFWPFLQSLWDRRGQWTSTQDFRSLNEPTLELLHSFGLFPQISGEDTLFIDVPSDWSSEFD